MDSYCTLSVLMGMPDPRVETLNKFKFHDNPKPIHSGGKSLVGLKVTIPNNRSGDKKRPSSSIEEGRCNHCGQKNHSTSTCVITTLRGFKEEDHTKYVNPDADIQYSDSEAGKLLATDFQGKKAFYLQDKDFKPSSGRAAPTGKPNSTSYPKNRDDKKHRKKEEVR